MILNSDRLSNFSDKSNILALAGIGKFINYYSLISVVSELLTLYVRWFGAFSMLIALWVAALKSLELTFLISNLMSEQSASKSLFSFIFLPSCKRWKCASSSIFRCAFSVWSSLLIELFLDICVNFCCNSLKDLDLLNLFLRDPVKQQKC